jgi:hypothetical protein
MEQQENLFDLHLDPQSVNYLSETARWSRFLSILGFILCGLMALMGLFFGSFMSRLMPNGGENPAFAMIGAGVFSTVFIICALIMFFPTLYLYNFSTKTRRALSNNDQPVLAESLKNLKSFFKFFGILAIIYLSLYALALISAIIGAMVGSHRP